MITEEGRMGYGYCPRCLKPKDKCTCLEDSFKQGPLGNLTAKNIFCGAKFGDKFRTRNGKLAIYQRQVDKDCHLLMLEKEDGIYLVAYFSNGDGYVIEGYRQPQEDDIVSTWI